MSQQKSRPKATNGLIIKPGLHWNDQKMAFLCLVLFHKKNLVIETLKEEIHPIVWEEIKFEDKKIHIMEIRHGCVLEFRRNAQTPSLKFRLPFQRLKTVD